VAQRVGRIINKILNTSNKVISYCCIPLVEMPHSLCYSIIATQYAVKTKLGSDEG